jgi:peroxiredoxin
MAAADSPETEFPRRIAYLLDDQLTIRACYEVGDPEFFAEDVLDDLERLRD